MRAADPAVSKRSPRLHGDFPEQNFAELVEELFDVIGRTDRYATGRDHHVCRGGRSGKRALELIRHVLDHAHVDHVAIEPRQHAVQRIAIAVVDLAGLKRRADGLELVAGRKKRDAKLAKDADLADAQRCDHSQLGGMDTLAGAEDDLPGLQVLTRKAPVLSRFRHRTGRNANATGVFDGALLHHDGVGAPRHDAASEDAHAFARSYRARPWLARERLTDAPEQRISVLPQILEAHGVAVHRRIVVARHRDRRHHVFRQHASERAADMNTLGRGHRCQNAANQLARLCHRHRIRIVVVGAGRLAQCPGCAAHVWLRYWSDLMSSCWSSSRVLMFRKASASSSNATSMVLSVAYQASIFRPPPSRNRVRCGNTERRTSANTGWG